MRSLTVRILLAVLGTLLVSLVAFMATFLAMSGPANVRLIRQFQARQIEDGIAALQQGPGAAAAFIARLDQSLGATHYLTDAAGRDLITGEDRSALLRVPRPWFGPPQIDDRLVVVEPSRDGRYRLIVLAKPPFNIWSFVPYYVLILATVVCLTWLLAIGIVRPLRQVARAVRERKILGIGHTDVALTSNGSDCGPADALQLPPQVAHVHIERSFVRCGLPLMEHACELVARDNPADGSHQHFEDRQFSGCQLDWHTAIGSSTVECIDSQIADLHHTGHQIRPLKRPTQHCANSGE